MPDKTVLSFLYHVIHDEEVTDNFKEETETAMSDFALPAGVKGAVRDASRQPTRPQDAQVQTVLAYLQIEIQNNIAAITGDWRIAPGHPKGTIPFLYYIIHGQDAQRPIEPDIEKVMRDFDLPFGVRGALRDLKDQNQNQPNEVYIQTILNYVGPELKAMYPVIW